MEDWLLMVLQYWKATNKIEWKLEVWPCYPQHWYGNWRFDLSSSLIFWLNSIARKIVPAQIINNNGWLIIAKLINLWIDGWNELISLWDKNKKWSELFFDWWLFSWTIAKVSSNFNWKNLGRKNFDDNRAKF